MKFFHSKTALRLFFILLLLITLYLLSCVLKVKSGHGIDQQEGLYWQEENSIDVMFLGTSHVHCNINTGLLYDSYGITAYDYSGAEQPLWMTYYYLKELYRYQTPELLSREYYISCDMSKYIAYIIDTLNHDSSISDLLNPYDRIKNYVKKYNDAKNA